MATYECFSGFEMNTIFAILYIVVSILMIGEQ